MVTDIMLSLQVLSSDDPEGRRGYALLWSHVMQQVCKPRDLVQSQSVVWRDHATHPYATDHLLNNLCGLLAYEALWPAATGSNYEEIASHAALCITLADIQLGRLSPKITQIAQDLALHRVLDMTARALARFLMARRALGLTLDQDAPTDGVHSRITRLRSRSHELPWRDAVKDEIKEECISSMDILLAMLTPVPHERDEL